MPSHSFLTPRQFRRLEECAHHGHPSSAARRSATPSGFRWLAVHSHDASLTARRCCSMTIQHDASCHFMPCCPGLSIRCRAGRSSTPCAPTSASTRWPPTRAPGTSCWALEAGGAAACCCLLLLLLLLGAGHLSAVAAAAALQPCCSSALPGSRPTLPASSPNPLHCLLPRRLLLRVGCAGH